MRYLALASDYDGTLAHDGRVRPSTIEALGKLKESGRKLIMVTGRELPDLKTVFDRFDLFDYVVAENGALLFNPADQCETPLSEAPPVAFLENLSRNGVEFSVGKNIVATTTPYAEKVLQAIQELGLEMQVIFNKGAAMVLPSGVNKATGLQAALDKMRLSAHNVVGVGDAENDHALLATCEFSVAVANSVEMLKERADWVTSGARGQGVEELIAKMVEDDLCSFDPQLQRHRLVIGKKADGESVHVAQTRGSILIAGPSGSGKSTLTSSLLEQMMEQKYQFCLIDPEGDYDGLPDAIMIGTPSDAPNLAEIDKALDAASRNVVVNLLAIPLSDRPVFFAGLLGRLLELRTATGRPHWIVVDEAHHMLAKSWVPAPAMLPQSLGGMVFITVHPSWMADASLQAIDTFVAIGKESKKTIIDFAQAVGEQVPTDLGEQDLESGEADVWLRREGSPVGRVKTEKGSFERRRHVRKYAEGELPEERSFYFRGPKGALNLRAQNLNMFLQIADGVDDDTWMHHLKKKEYSAWMRSKIKDDDLADEIASIEREVRDPKESRERVKEAVERRYTAAA